MSHDLRGQAATGDFIEDRTQLLRVRHDLLDCCFESVASVVCITQEITTARREASGHVTANGKIALPLSYDDCSTGGFEPPAR